ncbi:hypothetical protein [Rhodococcus sp. KRD197]|uniref:hypothetical protein n=1 Tax=Rhodococcus sp. KRD197 TaxID=2729731 RepID=UPI0019CF89B7|nr:hypothetical protein [Rhodococcus sp. KRD197]
MADRTRIERLGHDLHVRQYGSTIENIDWVAMYDQDGGAVWLEVGVLTFVVQQTSEPVGPCIIGYVDERHTNWNDALVRSLIAAGAAAFFVGGLVCVALVSWWLGQPTQCISSAPLTSLMSDPAAPSTNSLCPGRDADLVPYLIAGPLAAAVIGAVTGLIAWRAGFRVARTE